MQTKIGKKQLYLEVCMIQFVLFLFSIKRVRFIFLHIILFHELILFYFILFFSISFETNNKQKTIDA